MYRISKSNLEGDFTVPSSKSQTLRAILFAALASGTSSIEDFLDSPDTDAMIQAIVSLGAFVERYQRTLQIQGIGGVPKVAEDVINCGNSGIVLRFIGALAGLMPHCTILTGDLSIRHNRLASPLLDALNQLGARAESSRGDGFAPILIKGPISRSHATLDGADSQPVSGLLIAAAFASHPIEIHVLNPGEKPWIDLTLSWFDRLGIQYERKGYDWYKLKGSSIISSFTYRVPGDFSSAAFPIAAALITDSKLTLHNLDMDECQGDKVLITILQQMGARFTIGNNRLTVEKGGLLQGIRVDLNECVDALPILSVIGCFSSGKTEIVGAAVARNKESDRIHCMAKELKKMGANIEERADGLLIYSSPLQGAALESHQDHRLLFSLSVAALAANGDSTILGAVCGAKTMPRFYEDFRSIGANIEFDSIRL